MALMATKEKIGLWSSAQGDGPTPHAASGKLVPLPADGTLLIGFGSDRQGEAYVTFWEKVSI